METALVGDEATGWAADCCADEATGWAADWCVDEAAGAGTGATAEAAAGAGKSSCTLYSAPWGIFHKLKSASGRTTSICRGSSWEAKEKSAHIIISESSGEGL